MKFSQAPRFQETFNSKTALQGTILGAHNSKEDIPQSVRSLKKPPLAGFAAGLQHSDFIKFLSYLAPLKTTSMINTLYKEGVSESEKLEPSWTVFNSKVVKETTKLLQNSENKLDRVRSNVHWAPFLKSVQKIKEIASKRAAQVEPQIDNKYLGIENHNLAAIQQAAAIKDEVISVREVGNESAVAHQRASLPTKPFSIKMKSERTTGFVPVDQFINANAKAKGDLGNPQQIVSTKYIFEQVAQLSKRTYLPDYVIDKIVEDQKNNTGNLDAALGAHSNKGLKNAEDLIQYLYKTAASKGPVIDGHEPASITKIMSNEKVSRNQSREKHLKDIFKDQDKGKEYVVYDGLPIIGDYDIYKLHVHKDKAKAFGQLPNQAMDTLEGRANIPGVGYTTPYVIGSVIDYNVAVALSGYDGGLVFHHAAEMDNLKNIQKKGPVLFVDKNKAVVAGRGVPEEQVRQDIHKTEIEIERSGHVTRNRSESLIDKNKQIKEPVI